MSSSPKWVKQKFEWLEAIAADPNLSDRAVRVAIAISKHLNSRSGDAHPSQQTLGAACGTSARRVRDALQALIEAGYLTSRRRGRDAGGAGLSNVYAPIFDRTIPADQNELSIGANRPVEAVSTGRISTFDGTKSVILTGGNRPTNPLREPFKEPIDVTDVVSSAAKRVHANALVERLVEAAGDNVENGSSGIEIVKPIRDLMAMDCDLDLDILAVIRERVPRMSSRLRTWNAQWLREAILEHRTKRLAARPATPFATREDDEARWDNMLRAWFTNRQWPGSWGNTPDEPRCQVPQTFIDRWKAENLKDGRTS